MSEPQNVQEFMQAIVDTARDTSPLTWIGAEADQLAFQLIPHLHRVTTPANAFELPATSDAFALLYAYDSLIQAKNETRTPQIGVRLNVLYGRVAESLSAAIAYLQSVGASTDSLVSLTQRAELLERYVEAREDEAWAAAK